MNISSELLRVAKILSANKPGEFIEVGDSVSAKTGKGIKELVVVSIRYMRRGNFMYELTLAEPDRPEAVWRYKIKSNRYADNLTVKFLGKTSGKKLQQHQQIVTENIMKRNDTIGEVKDAGRAALDNLKLQKGDEIKVRGPGYNWTAIVGDINYATGKVGIVRKQVQLDPIQNELLGILRGRPVRTREFRWIPAQNVVEVTKRGTPQ